MGKVSKQKKLASFRLFLGIWLTVALSLVGLNIYQKRLPGQITNSFAPKVFKSVQAQEIYPLFQCPCCGQSIDQCTCPMAKERSAFVDGLVAGHLTKDETVMAYVKKYGLASFIDESQQGEYREKLIDQAPAERPIISVIPTSEDLGDVSQKEGVITTLFEIRNEGQADLVIDRLETSCGCTSASIVYQDQEGPKFTMPGHGQENPTDWQIKLSVGEKAQLKVYYDPATHPDFRGPAIREVSVFSNDPIDFEKKVKIELNQVD